MLKTSFKKARAGLCLLFAALACSTAVAKAGYSLLHGWSYRDMWWVTHDDHGAYMARGVHGQRIYIDPRAEMVIVRYASHPVASDPVTLAAFEALGNFLLAHPQK